jgi:hypothetical protein
MRLATAYRAAVPNRADLTHPDEQGRQRQIVDVAVDASAGSWGPRAHLIGSSISIPRCGPTGRRSYSSVTEVKPIRS